MQRKNAMFYERHPVYISSNLYYNLDPIQHQIWRSFHLNILVAWRALTCYTYLNNSFLAILYCVEFVKKEFVASVKLNRHFNEII